jgi:SSS family solute:Na+ symporter
MATQLYEAELTAPGATTDAAYPLLIRNLIPAGLRGFVFAAIAGAVISTLASMLNSVSAILTVDLYQRHWRKDASPESLVKIGRISTLAFVIVVCLIAPKLGSPRFNGIFNYIQEFHGYISPGILAAFGFGWLAKRAPSAAGIAALLLSVPVYGYLQWQHSDIAYLNRQAITLGILVAVMAAITLWRPRLTPKPMPERAGFDMRLDPSVKWIGVGLLSATVALYLAFL